MKPTIEIHLMAPLFVDTLVQLFEEEGYEVELRVGDVHIANDLGLVGFIVGHIDPEVLALIASKVYEWIKGTALRDSFRNKSYAPVTISESENVTINFIQINLNMRGDYKVIHQSPGPKPGEEE